MKTEKYLFEQAYLSLRTADSIPFPDAVFDEYVRLRDSEGYKLVPLEPSAKMLEIGSNALGNGKMGFTTYMDVNNSYKAMIGVVDE